MTTADTFIASASVILLREQENRPEILLLKKNNNISFGGSWVFPGGRVDAEDIANQNLKDKDLSTEANTARRECEEETGLFINAEKLLPISRWTTPAIRPKRFKTVFFTYDARGLTGEAIVDGGEIVEVQWLCITEALAQHNQKKIKLAGPAFVTLKQIAEFDNVDQIMNFFSEQAFTDYSPRVQLTQQGAISLYLGDSCYHLIAENGVSDDSTVLKEIQQASRQHRLYMHKDEPWRYVNTAT